MNGTSINANTILSFKNIKYNLNEKEEEEIWRDKELNAWRDKFIRLISKCQIKCSKYPSVI
jgi:hypothetical protein